MQGTTTRTDVTVRGRVETVFFAGPRFSAGRLRTADGDGIQFAGRLFARVGDRLALHGHWIQHPRFGRQVQVERMEYDLELDADGLAHYLANHPSIKGIGPVKARRIADAFGEDFDRAITMEPEAVAEAGKLSADTLAHLKQEWERTREINRVITWLAAFELTHHQVTSLVDKFGNNAHGILRENPYIICREISGFGFKKVDRIARRLGTPKDHPARIRAGLIHCVEEALGRGDCWVEYEELLDRANLLLVMDVLDSRERIEKHLDGLIDDGTLGCTSLGGRFLVARPSILKMEQDLARILRTGDRPNPYLRGVDNLEALIDRTAPQLNESQRSAVRTALSHSISLISGAAGSGKTFTVAAITGIFQERGLRVILAAPTGKAAKRLEQVVGHPASTIHRLLGFQGKTFARGPEDPLDAELVIADEASMIDVSLAWHLFRAIDRQRTAVVLVGDHNQLPPVGPGNLLRDLIATRAAPTVVLDQVVRQAGVLKENSLAVLSGQVHKTSDKKPCGRRPWYLVDQFTDGQQAQRFLLELFQNVLVERLGFDLVRDVQVLTPTHKGPLGTRELNILLQRLIQKKCYGVEAPETLPGRRPKFLAGDKVIQTRNNYQLGVMNGASGIVRDVARDGTLWVEFDGREVEYGAGSDHARDLQLGFVISIHKGQGSEFPCAIVIVHKSHSFMHHRNLFYTGVTRARESAVIVGDRWGIRNCAQRREVANRKTFLSMLLDGIDEDENEPGLGG